MADHSIYNLRYKKKEIGWWLDLNLSEVNIELFRLINELGKEYTYLNPIFSFIAEYTVFFLALGVLTIWFKRDKHRRLMILCAIITFICAFIIGKICGAFHLNYQPFVELSDVNKLIEKEKDNSFPSDHTILFFSFCITFWLFKRGWSILWIFLAILVGISRIWVGVHYPFDVVVGIVISFATATIIYFTLPKLSVTRNILLFYEKFEDKLFQPLKKSIESKTKNY